MVDGRVWRERTPALFIGAGQRGAGPLKNRQQSEDRWALMKKTPGNTGRKSGLYQDRKSLFRMAGSLALVLVLIAGVLVFVNSINDNLREDTESGIKSMTKIGAD